MSITILVGIAGLIIGGVIMTLVYRNNIKKSEEIIADLKKRINIK